MEICDCHSFLHLEKKAFMLVEKCECRYVISLYSIAVAILNLSIYLLHNKKLY